jgi:hypothetical protein
VLLHHSAKSPVLRLTSTVACGDVSWGAHKLRDVQDGRVPIVFDLLTRRCMTL